MGKLFFAAKAFIQQDSKFLALKLAKEKNDRWELPGGRMEFGETMEETLIREVKEETNLTIVPGPILTTWDLFEEKRQISGIIYSCKYKWGNIELSQEHREYAWFSFDQVDKLYPVFFSRLKTIDLQLWFRYKRSYV